MGGHELEWSLLWTPPVREWVISAIGLTFEISLIGWVCALVLGCIVGLLRGSPRRALRGIAALYVEVFRNVPLMVQLFFVYFAVPFLFPLTIRRTLVAMGWEFITAVTVLSFYTGAKVAEHVRAGLNAVSIEIKQSGAASGLTWWQVQRFVVAPLVLRIIIPSLTSEFLTIFKSSSLAMAVGVIEISYVTQKIGFRTFHWIEANTFGTVSYLVISWGVVVLMGIIERRTYIPGLLRRGQ